jgi:CRP-like cAMP-binding protein
LGFTQTGVFLVSEDSLKRTFGSIWWRFLEFEITRSRMMTEVAGNMSSALILQVVAYHNLTLIQSAVDSEAYNEIRSAWELADRTAGHDLPQKLSYAAISDMTRIDKETVRRSVKKLAEQGWVTVDKKNGISYSPSTVNQEKLLMLNEWEVTHLGRLLKRLSDAKRLG